MDIKNKSLTRDSQGHVYIAGRDDKKYLVNPKLIKQTSIYNKRTSSNVASEKFKLVTVRRLTNSTVATVTEELKTSQSVLEAAAARSGQPIPFPQPFPVDAANLIDYYAVYIDEDLYGTQNPIYVFGSPSPKIKCFITANGPNKEDWSVHILHLLEKITQSDSTFTVKWRIYTIDNRIDGQPARIDYVLESATLPKCFEYNFDIENLNYLGGGTWSGLSVDKDDRIPILGLAPLESKDRYIQVGQPFRFQGQGNVLSIVAYSVTPTYSFTWCRGKLELNKRQKTFNQTTDIPTYITTGVIETTRDHNYQLDLIYRPLLSDANQTILGITKQEFSTGSATYVSNTNETVGSLYQSPDFGTDRRRCAVRKYTMETNVIRPKTITYSNNLPIGKGSFQNTTLLPILASSPNMSNFIYLDLGTAKGSIDHPYELKGGVGSRGYDYPDYYPFWWAYGPIITLEPKDEGRYYYPKTTGLLPGIPTRGRIGNMYDLGTVFIDPDKPNRIKTTWASLLNPQTGFFGIEKGLMSWTFTYNNPPLIGHNGPYYYEIQPANISSAGGSYNNSFGASDSSTNTSFGSTFVGGAKDNNEQAQKNALIMTYNQLASSLGNNAGFESLNIGFVRIAVNDGASIVLREPNEEMTAYLRSYPETFPHGSIGGFWESDFLNVTIENNGQGVKQYLNSDGSVLREDII